MCIILPLGRTVQIYLRKYGERGPALSLHCPGCDKQMQRHGRYWRWVFTAREKARIPIYRWKCRECRVTHSVLPDFLRPYARFVSWVRELVVRGRLRRKMSWAQLVELVSSEEVSWLSEKTLRRWLRRARNLAGEWGRVLAQRILEFWPGTDVYALAPRRDGSDAALHLLLDVGGWYLNQAERQLHEHPGLFAILNRLGEGPAAL